MTTRIDPMFFLNKSGTGGASIRLYRTALAYHKSLREGYTREKHLKKHGFYANHGVPKKEWWWSQSDTRESGARFARCAACRHGNPCTHYPREARALLRQDIQV